MIPQARAEREELLVRLREPGPESDQLIADLMGLDVRQWTRDFTLAETLIPMSAIYTLSHNDDRTFYWCDVSDARLTVQGWGRTPCCALAAAGVAYAMETRPGTGCTGARRRSLISLH